MAARTEKKLVRSWNYVFLTDETVSCLFCRQKDRPQLVRTASETDLPESVPPKDGLCEACSVHAYHLWQKSKGDFPPGFHDEVACKVSRVKVLVPRIMTSVSGKADPGPVGSYEFLLAQDGEIWDLPGADLTGANTEVEAAVNALKDVGIITWNQFIEPLWMGFTPRGRLASVVMVTAWTKPEGLVSKPSGWRNWPVHDHVPDSLKGFYLGLAQAWSLRLFKHHSIVLSQRTDEISVCLREGAVKYIEIQRGRRNNKKDLDVSMAEYAKKSMSDDERKIEHLIEKYETGEVEVAKLEAEKAEMSPETEGEVGAASESGETEAEDEGEDSEGGTTRQDVQGVSTPSTFGPRGHSPTVTIEPGSGEEEDPHEWGNEILARVGVEIGVGDEASPVDPSPKDDQLDEDAPEPGFARKGRPLTTTPDK